MSFGRFKDDNNSNRGQAASDSTRDSTGQPGDKREAYISKGSKIIGTMQFSGPTELDGQVDGEVIAQDRLVIGEAAIVNAKISGTEVIVKGVVNGDITASKRLILKKSARVEGSITSPILSIEEGVIFEGKIAMIAAEKKSLEAVSVDNKSVATSSISSSKQLDVKLGETKTGFTTAS